MSESRFSDIAKLHKTILEPKPANICGFFFYPANIHVSNAIISSIATPIRFRVPPLLRVFEESGV